MEESRDLIEFRKSVQIYHLFPSLIAILILCVFLGVFFLTNNYLLASLAAGLPATLLLWRWSVAGRLIDRWPCSQCGKTFKGKLVWKYPPSKCPHCGTSLPG
jgi:hypothetical protein